MGGTPAPPFKIEDKKGTPPDKTEEELKKASEAIPNGLPDLASAYELQIDPQCILIEMAHKMWKWGNAAAPKRGLLADFGTGHKRSLSYSTETTSGTTHERKGVADISDLGSYQDNHKFITQITFPEKFPKFMDIKPAQVAELSPYLRISVGYYNRNGQLLKKGLFPLNFSHNPQNEFLLQSSGRRRAAGVKSVNIVHEGIDSATEKMVKIESTFIIQDFRQLTKEGSLRRMSSYNPGLNKMLKGKGPTYSSLLELDPRVSVKGSDASLYRYIVFDFGWESRTGMEDYVPPRGRIKAFLVKYTFDFDEDGSIVLKTTHRGNIENAVNGPSSNILSRVREQQSEMQSKYNELLREEQHKISQSNHKSKIDQQESLLAAETLNVLVQAMIFGNRAKRSRYRPHGDSRWGADGDQKFYHYYTFGLKQDMNSYNTQVAPAVRNLLARQGIDMSSDFAQGVQDRVYDLYRNFIRDAQDEAATHKRRYHNNGFFKPYIPPGTNMGVTSGAPSMAQKNLPMLESDPDRVSKDYDTDKRTSYTYADARMNFGGRDDKFTFQHPQAAAAWITDYLNGTVKDRKENLKTIEKNLEVRNVAQLAQQKLAAQMGLLRFQGLVEIAEELLSSQTIHVGTLDMKTIGNIQSNIGVKGRLRGVFASISASNFLSKSALGVASRANPRSRKSSVLYPRKRSKSAAMKAAQKALQQDEVQTIPFVFFGEFLNSVLRLTGVKGLKGESQDILHLIESSTGEAFQTVMGYMDFDTPFTGSVINRFPLYYFPISLTKLNDFFAREIIGKDLEFYSYGDMIRGLVDRFITSQFRVCSTQAQIGSRAGHPKIDMVVGEPGKATKSGTAGSATAIPNWRQRRILFLYDQKHFLKGVTLKKFGKYSTNKKLKIPHFWLGGRDRGIAKKIQVIDIADPTLKTAVYLRPRASAIADIAQTNVPQHQGGWAPVVFKGNVTTLGCPFFNLGQKFYLDLSHFVTGKSARYFRATGYYGIYKVTHKITPDEYTTEVEGLIQMTKADYRAKLRREKGNKPVGTKGATPPTSKTTPKTPAAGTTSTTGVKKTPIDPFAATPEQQEELDKLNKAITNMRKLSGRKDPKDGIVIRSPYGKYGQKVGPPPAAYMKLVKTATDPAVPGDTEYNVSDWWTKGTYSKPQSVIAPKTGKEITEEEVKKSSVKPIHTHDNTGGVTWTGPGGNKQ